MSRFFPRTGGFADSDNARGWLALGVMALIICGVWLIWLTTAEVTLVETALDARLESAGYVHSVESIAAGKVVELSSSLGQVVAAGDLLMILETEHQEHALEEARAQVKGWQERLEASTAALENHRLLADREETRTQRRLEEIQAKQAVELVTLEYAEKRVQRSEKLFDLGLVSEVDLLHHQGDAEKAGAEARVRQAEAQALEATHRRDAVKQATELADIENDLGEAHGQIEALEARIELLLHEIEDRHLRAPVAGRIGWQAPLRVGAVAQVGDRLVDLVPEEDLRVVGFFAPTSVGRLAVGQRATLRLDALPWTRHGRVNLRIERLSTEVEDGRVEVELAVLDRGDLPLTHGMTGRLEVAVEPVSPARWLLHAVGRGAQAPR